MTSNTTPSDTERRKRPSNQRCTIEKMHQLASERGGLCLSTTYVNTDTHLLWQCAKQHQWHARPSCIKRGTWCKICAIDKSRRTLEEMQTLAERHGGKLLSTKYVNYLHKLQWQCAKGHTWLSTGVNVKWATGVSSAITTETGIL
jgi:hypothetical protein